MPALAYTTYTNWTNFPIQKGFRTGEYRNFIQFWFATRNVTQCLNFRFFPPEWQSSNNGIRLWYTDRNGTNTTSITNVVDHLDGTSTFTFSFSGSNTFGLPTGGYTDPWNKTTDTDPDDAGLYPSTWKLGVGNFDPIQALTGPVNTWGSNTITLNVRANDWVTSGRITALSDFYGQQFAIIGDGLPYWPEQWPEWPNYPASATNTVSSATATNVTVVGATWPKDKWAGHDYIGRGSNGNLLRLPISGNGTASISGSLGASITFGTTAAEIPIGDFAILPTGNQLYLPGQIPCNPATFYTGEMSGQILSHDPDDNLRPALVIVPSVSTSEGEDVTDCPDPTQKQIAYINYVTDPLNLCGPAGVPLNPNVTKSYGYLQFFLRSVCTAFYPSTGPQDSTKDTAFASFRPATYYKAWGADSVTTTVGSLGSNSAGQFGCSTGAGGTNFIAYPINVYYATLSGPTGGGALGGDGDFGTGVLTSDGFLTGGFGTNDVGNALVISPGERRYWAKQFDRMNDVTYWMPDLDPDSEDGTGYIVPPREPLPGETAGPGTWHTIPASTHYSQASPIRLDSTNSVDAFVNGDVARFRGGSFFDPSTPYAAGDSVPAAATFYDRTFQGPYSPKNTAHRKAALAFSTSTFTATQITATNGINWATTNFWGDTGDGGILIMLTGTASSGSTTSLHDTSKSASGFWVNAGTNSQWLNGQTLQTFSGTNLINRLITSKPGDTELDFDVPLTTAVSSSTIYQIPVLNSLANQWKGSNNVVVTPIFMNGTSTVGGTVGATFRLSARGNGSSTIYLPDWSSNVGSISNLASVKVAIDDPLVTATYQRIDDKWFIASGTDTVRLPRVTAAANFQTNPYMNLADTVQRWGPYCPGDHVVEAMAQLYFAINVLDTAKYSGGWTAYNSPTATSPDANSTSGHISLESNGPNCVKQCDEDPDPVFQTESNLHECFQLIFAGNGSASCCAGYGSVGGGPPATGGTPPFGSVSLDWGGGGDISASAQYDNYSVVGIPTPFPSTVYAWNWGQIDEDDDAPESTSTTAFDFCSQADQTTVTSTEFAAPSGVPVAYHTWSLSGSGSPDGNGNFWTGQIGTIAEPAWPATPIYGFGPILDAFGDGIGDCCEGGNDVTAGWWIGDDVALVKFVKPFRAP